MINPSVADLTGETGEEQDEVPVYEPVRRLTSAERQQAARSTVGEASSRARDAEAERNMLLDDLAAATADQLLGDDEGVTATLIADLEAGVADAERQIRRYDAARLALRNIAGYA